jgi:hypothetical protein
MGIFDIFSNSDAQNAAQAQITGLNNAYAQAVPLLQQGTGAINQYYQAGQGQLQNNANAAGGALGTNYGGALQTLQNQQGTNAAGQNQLANLLGLNGANGSATAQNTLQNLPGYQFALNQGSQNVMRNQAATGALNSGATQADLQAQGQGLASQNYNNYVSQLQPFLGASNTGAANIAGTQTGLGQNLAANYNTLGSNMNQNLMGAGNAINQNLGTQAQAAYGTQAGIGNAQAQSDYAQLAQSGAIFGGLMGLGGAALKGGAGGGLGSGISSAFAPGGMFNYSTSPTFGFG